MKKKNFTCIEIFVQGAGEDAASYRTRLQKAINEVCDRKDVFGGVQVSTSAAGDGRMTAVLVWNEEKNAYGIPDDLKVKYRSVKPETALHETLMTMKLVHTLARLCNQFGQSVNVKTITARDVSKLGKQQIANSAGIGRVTVTEIQVMLECAGLNFAERAK